jgi:hypothetical protein
MPLKTLKGFGRRKSSGNVFDELNNTPAADTNSPQEGSFRVLTRPDSYNERAHSEGPGPVYKSFEGGKKLSAWVNSRRDQHDSSVDEKTKVNRYDQDQSV